MIIGFPANITQLRGHNVIAASGKGGVGKTWFSITLTHALTKLGRNTLLFDGDLGLANVDIQLGLMPKRDLGPWWMAAYSLQAAAERFPMADSTSSPAGRDQVIWRTSMAAAQ